MVEGEEERRLLDDLRRHAQLAVACSRHVVSVRASLLLVRASLQHGFLETTPHPLLVEF